jgi:hypothetical protein
LGAEEGGEDTESEGEEPGEEGEDVIPVETVEGQVAGVEADGEKDEGEGYQSPGYWLRVAIC